MSSQPEGGEVDHAPYKKRKQLLSVLVALGAMLSYALLSGIVSIQHVQQEPLDGFKTLRSLSPLEGDEEED